MALDSVAVCNQALGLLGAKSITTLGDNSNAARLCNALYEVIRDEVLAAREWAFATKWEAVTPSSVPPGNPRYSTRYKRPSDLLRVLEACSADGEKDLDWTPEGEYLLTDGVSDTVAAAASYTPTALVELGTASNHYVAFLVVVGACAAGPHRVVICFDKWSGGGDDYPDLIVTVDGAVYRVSAESGWWPLFTAVGFQDITGDSAFAGLDLWLAAFSATANEYLDASWTFDLGTPRAPGGGLLYVRYLAQITDPALWPSYFTSSMVARLAAALAVPLTENVSLAQSMEQLYRARLHEAAAVDGMQGRNSERPARRFANSRRT